MMLAIDAGLRASVQRSEAYRASIRQAQRAANRKRQTIGVFVDKWRLSRNGISRRVFRVIHEDAFTEDRGDWQLVARVNPEQQTTAAGIRSVLAAEGRKRAAPWEGRGNRD